MLSLIQKMQEKITPLSLTVFNILLAVWCGLVLNIAFYQQIQQLTPYSGIKAQLFVLASVLVVVGVYHLVFQLLHWRWNARIFAAIFIFIGGFSAYFVNSLGVVISADQIQNMMQTDPNETLDLLSLRMLLWSILLVFLPLALVFLIRIKPEKLSSTILKKLTAIVVSAVVVVSMLFAFYVDYAAMFREHRDLKGMISPQNVIASTISYYRKIAPRKNLPLVSYGEDAHRILKASQQAPKLMVLVVGETARAESFALNGYGRNTNPELQKQDIINFSQVSSCGTATAVSVPCMFSGMTRQDYDARLASHREGMLDIAKRAGYKVTWIDNNSGCKGTCDRVEQYQIPETLRRQWCDADGECRDEILVDSLKQYIKDIPADDQTPRLVVLHQMGSHGPAYFKRSVQPHQPFQPACNTTAIQGCKPQELINSYDNSIVYTDFVLSSLIDELNKVSQYQTGFWYLSDHGESTGEHGLYLHGSPYAIAPSQQTHVPMLMWFSDSWKKNAARQISCLNAQKTQQLSQDNLFPSMLHLLDISTQVADENNDMLKQCSSTNS